MVAAGNDRHVRLVLDRAPTMAWTTGADGRCTFVNGPWLEFTGRELENELGDGWTEIIHPDDRPEARSTYQAAFDARHPFRMEYRARRHDGLFRTILDFGVPTHSEGGDFTGYLGFCIDVTELRDAERTAQADRKRYESVLDTLSAHVAVLDPEGEILFVNRAWRAFGERCGLALPEAGVGTNYLAVCDASVGGDSEEASPVARGIRDVISGRIPRFEIEYPCHDTGERRWFFLRILPIAGGGELAALTEHADVTALRLAEDHRQRLEAKMQDSQRLESIGTLAGGIAHDFNNLLTVILGSADLATRDLAPDAHLRDRLERIRKAAQTAARLTNQMLTYAGKGSVVLRPENLSQLVAEMRDLMEAASGREASLDLRLSPGLPAIEADATQIGQVILNLVANAFEALVGAHGTVRVTTSRVSADAAHLAGCFGVPDPEPGEYVALEVSDTGEGIDPADQVRLFEPFFSTKLSGRGLGLSSVLGIVKAHGGVIKVTSERGAGATFQVLLPPSGGSVAETRSNPGEREGGGHRILVVDDEPAVLEIAVEYLMRAGFDVIFAEGGRKAIEIFRAHGDGIDAVVLDLAMPEVSGQQVFSALRGMRGDVPVVLVSGYSEELAADRFVGDGLAGFLRKPYEAEQLVEVLNTAIARRARAYPS